MLNVMKVAARAGLVWIAVLVASPAQATEVARYQVTFDATWSAATHPTDFPSNPHFSPPVVATHSVLLSFWNPGQLASDGIQNMAELGSTDPLTTEMATAGARTLEIGGGFNSPGSRTIEFDVFDFDPYVTMVSMIAPSPDWFVGVSGVALHTGAAWVDPLVIQLVPWDAGTDSGVSFESSNQVTNPFVLISQITGFPFTGAPPLGTFSFELVRVLADCENHLDDDGDGLTDELDPGCSDPSDTSEQDPGLACDNGLDDDGDFLTDLDDPGCDGGPGDPSERSDLLVCDDGEDNDGDGDIDYPADSGCLGPEDPTEEAIEIVPALSPGSVAALAALLLLAARARLASRRA
jgi:hypothetical protein